MNNIGPAKFNPVGPACCFNRKRIDFFTISSKSEYITAEISVDILKCFERSKIFLQIPGDPITFLLVDWHNIWLDPALIADINDIEHWWKVCFDVPYATLLWQVKDLAEINRTFESVFYHAKDELSLWEYKQGLTRAIKHKDFMPLWMMSF